MKTDRRGFLGLLGIGGATIKTIGVGPVEKMPQVEAKIVDADEKKVVLAEPKVVPVREIPVAPSRYTECILRDVTNGMEICRFPIEEWHFKIENVPVLKRDEIGAVVIPTNSTLTMDIHREYLSYSGSQISLAGRY